MLLNSGVLVSSELTHFINYRSGSRAIAMKVCQPEAEPMRTIHYNAKATNEFT
jgi:hypothetical protein